MSRFIKSGAIVITDYKCTINKSIRVKKWIDAEFLDALQIWNSFNYEDTTIGTYIHVKQDEGKFVCVNPPDNEVVRINRDSYWALQCLNKCSFIKHWTFDGDFKGQGTTLFQDAQVFGQRVRSSEFINRFFHLNSTELVRNFVSDVVQSALGISSPLKTIWFGKLMEDDFSVDVEIPHLLLVDDNCPPSAIGPEASVAGPSGLSNQGGNALGNKFLLKLNEKSRLLEEEEKKLKALNDEIHELHDKCDRSGREKTKNAKDKDGKTKSDNEKTNDEPEEKSEIGDLYQRFKALSTSGSDDQEYNNDNTSEQKQNTDNTDQNMSGKTRLTNRDILCYLEDPHAADFCTLIPILKPEFVQTCLSKNPYAARNYFREDDPQTVLNSLDKTIILACVEEQIRYLAETDIFSRTVKESVKPIVEEIYKEVNKNRPDINAFERLAEVIINKAVSKLDRFDTSFQELKNVLKTKIEFPQLVKEPPNYKKALIAEPEKTASQYKLPETDSDSDYTYD